MKRLAFCSLLAAATAGLVVVSACSDGGLTVELIDDAGKPTDAPSAAPSEDAFPSLLDADHDTDTGSLADANTERPSDATATTPDAGDTGLIQVIVDGTPFEFTGEVHASVYNEHEWLLRAWNTTGGKLRRITIHIIKRDVNDSGAPVLVEPTVGSYACNPAYPYLDSYVLYTGPEGQHMATSCEVILTQVGVGQPILGTFNASTTTPLPVDGNVSGNLSGHFRVTTVQPLF